MHYLLVLQVGVEVNFYTFCALCKKRKKKEVIAHTFHICTSCLHCSFFINFTLRIPQANDSVLYVVRLSVTNIMKECHEIHLKAQAAVPLLQ